jgi:hypothetical protein
MARRQPSELVVTDLDIPHLDSVQLRQAIPEDPVLCDIPVAILSGGIQRGAGPCTARCSSSAVPVTDIRLAGATGPGTSKSACSPLDEGERAAAFQAADSDQ